MRSFAFAVLAGLAPAVALAQFTWENPTPQGNSLRAVKYVSGTSTAYAVGDGNTILKSTNDGATWTVLAPPQGLLGLASIDCVDASTCFIAGNDVFRTTNGGAAWTRLNSGALYGLTSIDMVDATTGWAVGGLGIYKTTNGGMTWAAQALPADTTGVRRVRAVSATSAFIARSSSTMNASLVLRTTDGTTWAATTPPGAGSVYDLDFVDAAHGIVMLAGAGIAVAVTANGGASWTTSATPYGSAVELLDLNNAYVSGGGELLRSTNVAQAMPAWSNLGSANGAANALSCADAQRCIAVGSYGAIARTADGATALAVSSSGGTLGLSAAAAASLTQAVAVSQGSGIMYRQPAGSWAIAAANPPGAKLGVTASPNGVNADGWIAGWTPGASGGFQGTMAASLNSTNLSAWTAQTVPLGVDALMAVDHVSGNGPNAVVVAVGLTGDIIRTVNGGGTWTQVTSPVGTNLHAVHFPDAMTGFAVGANGVILKSTNAGISWTPQASNVTSSLHAVHFASATVGAAVSSTELLFTTNGGTTWQRRAASGLTRAFMPDTNTLYLLASGGVLSVAKPPLSLPKALAHPGVGIAAMTGLPGRPGELWLVGSGGAVLRTRCGGDGAIFCDDGQPCTTDLCNAGVCSHPGSLNGTVCDDGNGCTSGDVCDGGACTGAPVICNDNNSCTTDFCLAPSGGCAALFNIDGASCDDGNTCTTNDVCASGVCRGTGVVCVAPNSCTTSGCNPATMMCQVRTLAPGTPCSDNSVCTVNDRCVFGGVCNGTAVSCDDGNPCTADSCAADAGCRNRTLDAGVACNDQNACSSGDVCDGQGRCAGAPVSCDDNNPCTLDSCDPAAGCLHVGESDGTVCDDGNPCTMNDACAGALCIGFGQSCDDNNPCTQNTCDAGVCINPPVMASTGCDDRDACTQNDSCTVAGTCSGTPRTCDDGNSCTTDTCQSATGLCVSAALGDGSPCDDGNACTTSDSCDAGACAAGSPRSCDDMNACTVEVCEPASGCVVLPVPGCVADAGSAGGAGGGAAGGGAAGGSGGSGGSEAGGSGTAGSGPPASKCGCSSSGGELLLLLALALVRRRRLAAP